MKKILSIITFITLSYNASYGQNYLLESGESAFGIVGNYASNNGFSIIGAGANYTLKGKWTFYLTEGFGWYDKTELEDFNSISSALGVSFLVLKQDDDKPFNLGLNAGLELSTYPFAEIDIVGVGIGIGAEASYNIEAGGNTLITPLAGITHNRVSIIVEDETTSDNYNIIQLGCNFLFNKFYVEPRLNLVEDENYLSIGLGYIFR